MLFAIDNGSEEIVVSDSPKGSNRITLIERIGRNENSHLYDAVELLSGIARAGSFDPAIFKAMDKVCQLLYAQHKGSK
jgi:hypothetical protein